MMITLDRKNLTGTLLLIATSIVFLLLGFNDDSIAHGVGPNVSSSNPVVSDPNLRIEFVATGFDFPTGIAFLDNNDILLLEKNTGIVYRIIDGNITNPVIHLNVSSKDERGLLGIAVTANGESKQDDRLVFLYYTYCPKVKANLNSTSQGCGNYVYKYKLDTECSKLIEPMLILT